MGLRVLISFFFFSLIVNLHAVVFSLSPDIDIKAGYLSKYFWRGRVLNEDPLINLYADLDMRPFDINISYFSDFNSSSQPVARSWLDISPTIYIEKEYFKYMLGITVSSTFDSLDYELKNSEEYFAKIIYYSVLLKGLQCSLYIGYQPENNDGLYSQFDISHNIVITDSVDIEFFFDVGCGTSSFVDELFDNTINLDSLFSSAIKVQMPIISGFMDMDIVPGFKYSFVIGKGDRDLIKSIDEEPDALELFVFFRKII